MVDLKTHVDRLFSGYKTDRQIKELKEEILSNLEARVSDLTEKGMDHEAAVKAAVDSITTIDSLIDGNKSIYINRFKLELIQTALIYVLIGWIITTPLRLIRAEMLWNLLFLFAAVFLGITLMLFNRNKDASYLNETAAFNAHALERTKRIAWLLCILYIAVSILYTGAIRFGSSIWFSRAITINGPHQFSLLILSFILPFLCLIIPLLFHTALRLSKKYEVGEFNER